jgi:hypothetical protein
MSDLKSEDDFIAQVRPLFRAFSADRLSPDNFQQGKSCPSSIIFLVLKQLGVTFETEEEYLEHFSAVDLNQVRIPCLNSLGWLFDL